DIIQSARAAEAGEPYESATSPVRDRMDAEVDELPVEDLEALIRELTEEMHGAAGELRFEYAARLRDEVAELKRELDALRTANV
ncbi:MAG: UvrB/UvrC motif-containing protein, partial [Actinobacteria bacterium]|nr:UvrB/UvrC motif-containing protein [Actinomycetota bacterium]